MTESFVILEHKQTASDRNEINLYSVLYFPFLNVEESKNPTL